MGSLRAGLGGVPGLQNQSIAQTVDGSLRFDGSNDYLSKTFASAGDRKKWTWSGWAKRSAVNNTTGLVFYAEPSVTAYTQIGWSGDNFQLNIAYDGSTSAYIRAAAESRDPSAWAHYMAVYDSANATSTDRMILYINGVRVTNFSISAFPNQNALSPLNSNTTHYIGTRKNVNQYYDGYLSNVYFIDGLALGPGLFGFTDPLTGTWRPKRLRDGDANINDGRTWSSGSTLTDAAKAFDGNLTSGNYATIDTTTRILTTQTITVYSSLEIFTNNFELQTITLNINGQNYNNINAPDPGGVNGIWTTVPFTGTMVGNTTIVRSAGSASLWGVRVDGVVLIDSTTTNVDFGTNGFYLPLDDQDDYTTDRSGKGNNWTANGFTGTFSNPDVVPDSPSGVVGSTKPTSGITTTSSITKPTNYCTWSPIDRAQASSPDTIGTLSNGNLKATSSSGWTQTRGTFYLTSGKWYYEYTIDSTGSFPSIIGYVGADYNSGSGTRRAYKVDTNVFTYDVSGTENTESYGSGGATNGDVIGVMLDLDNGTIGFSKNGTDIGTARSDMLTNLPSSGWTPYVGLNGANGTANFGQRPFKFAPPDGYLTLCSANVRPSTVITRPNEYVGITTWSGAQSGSGGLTRQISTVFQPDFVWIKQRNQAYTTGHQLYDSVRGAGAEKELNSSGTAAEGAGNIETYGWLNSFDKTGFTVKGGSTDYDYVDKTGVNYVAWTWKAGGNSNTFNIDDVGYDTASAAGLTAGTKTISAISANTKSGFSIIKWNAGASPAGSYPHGLGKAPAFIIAKPLTTFQWDVYHKSLGKDAYLVLNTSASRVTGATTVWNSTSPDANTFSIGSAWANLGDVIVYAWAEIPGLSKFGSYTHNNSADGPFIELGFKPALILIKKYDVTGRSWVFIDSERDKFNVAKYNLWPNLTAGDTTTYDVLDILSNGFKVRTNTNGWVGESTNQYIYAAWAEAPSFNLYGGQANAR